MEDNKLNISFIALRHDSPWAFMSRQQDPNGWVSYEQLPMGAALTSTNMGFGPRSFFLKTGLESNEESAVMDEYWLLWDKPGVPLAEYQYMTFCLCVLDPHLRSVSREPFVFRAAVKFAQRARANFQCLR